MNGGGGGGGLISLTYVSGNINGNLTAYGGLGGGTSQSGAAGVVYLAKDINSLAPDRKVSFFANISLPISFHHWNVPFIFFLYNLNDKKRYSHILYIMHVSLSLYHEKQK